jgi:hypothetical protein
MSLVVLVPVQMGKSLTQGRSQIQSDSFSNLHHNNTWAISLKWPRVKTQSVLAVLQLYSSLHSLKINFVHRLTDIAITTKLLAKLL